MKRKMAVAGKFYPRDSEELLCNIKSCTPEVKQKNRAIGVLTPHAGFIYSGDVVGSVLASIEIPDTIILLGPNHTQQGPRVSLMHEGTWDSPLGEVEIDASLARTILETPSPIKADMLAHQYEHSLETQIPFIQHFRKDFKIIPICLQHISLNTCRTVSTAILAGIKKLNRNVLLIASSDMTHYEPHEKVEQKDKLAIAQILKLDPEGLYLTVRENSISMCGVIPTTIMLMTGNQLGAKNATLIKYTTSGKVTGKMNQVVGYAGMTIS